MFIGFVIFMLKLYYRHYSWVATRQLDKLMPFWQPANILHSVFIFMLLWQINVVVVVLVADILKFVTMFVTSFGKKG